jgi:hypothetical protein
MAAGHSSAATNTTMTATGPESAVSQADRSRFQFRLRTVLLLFVVLASSLALFGARGIVVFALAVGLAIYVNRAWPLMYLALILLCLLCCIGVPLSQNATRAAVFRWMCKDKLSNVSMALQNYHTEHGCFPPAYIADKNGKPMHSWRVLLLPYLGYDQLYKAYDFSEPWDGPHNKKLLAEQPVAYVCPCDGSAQALGVGQTSYVAVVGPGAAWPGTESRTLRSIDFRGGTRQTIMVVEAAGSGIAWTEPRDLSLDSVAVADAKPTVSSPHGDQGQSSFFVSGDDCEACVAMADGSVSDLMLDSHSAEELRELLQVGGCTERRLDYYAALHRERRRPNWPNIAALAVWLLSVGTLVRVAVRSRRRPSPV